jgi:simple sugar transport system ATP-binding protein
MTALGRRVTDLMQSLGLTIDLEARVDDLTVGQQQQLEIIRALARTPDILILDEPSAVLAPEERHSLFKLLARLRQGGIGIILISHRLDDIFECCDRVIVLRRGRVAGESTVAGLTHDQLVRLVVGEILSPPEQTVRRPVDTEIVVAVSGLSVFDDRARSVVHEVSFNLHAGEITALCGVEGNGQTELLQVLAGMRQPGRGRIRYRLGANELDSPVDAGELRRHGVGHIAEDRLRHAVLADRSLCDNWLMTFLHDPQLVRHGWLQLKKARQCVDEAIQTYAIKANDSSMRVRQLSGGNQQKLVLARELSRDPALLLAAHPARGLDARTTAFVHEALLDARRRGAAVLLLTADLDEAWKLADRVMVMHRGHLRGPVQIDDTTIEQVGLWMTTQ